MQKKPKKLRISFGGPMLLSILGEVIGVYRISLMIKDMERKEDYYDDNFNQLWSIDLTTNAEKKVYSAPWDIVGANFYENTNTLHVFINEDASTKLVFLSATIVTRPFRLKKKI